MLLRVNSFRLMTCTHRLLFLPFLDFKSILFPSRKDPLFPNLVQSLEYPPLGHNSREAHPYLETSRTAVETPEKRWIIPAFI